MIDNPQICTPCGVVDADWDRAENPLNSSAWGWLAVGAAALVGAFVIYREKQTSKTWSCRAAMECTHFTKTGKWQGRSLLDNSLELHDSPPDNLKDLTLDVTARDGSYHIYTLTKPAVMHGLPEYTP